MISWLSNYPAAIRPLPFGFLVITTGLMTIHLTLVGQSGNTNLWGTSLVLWVGVAALIWKQRLILSFKTSVSACLVGFLLISTVLLKSTSANYTFLYISPLLSGLGVGLFASGWRGLVQYRSALTVLGSFAVLNLPFMLFLDRLDISPWTAKCAAYILWYLGFNVHIQGQDLSLNTGGVVVYSGCSGLESILQLLVFAILFAAVFPLSTVQKWVMGFSAVTIGFGLNAVRVALLAYLNVYASKAMFEYWHQGTGSLLFSMIAVLGLGGVGELMLRSHDSGPRAIANRLVDDSVIEAPSLYDEP